jgi:uncharacterized membrane protein HdeD (DUF308 family)
LRFAFALTSKPSDLREVSPMQKNLGLLLLAVFLIIFGLAQILSLSFSGMPIVMGILALIAGILLILGR